MKSKEWEKRIKRPDVSVKLNLTCLCNCVSLSFPAKATYIWVTAVVASQQKPKTGCLDGSWLTRRISPRANALAIWFMSCPAKAAVANRGLVKFFVPGIATTFAKRGCPTPVVLAWRRDVAFAVNLRATPTFFPITGLVFSRLMPSKVARSSSAEWCRPVPVIDTFVGTHCQILLRAGFDVGRKIFASPRIGVAASRIHQTGLHGNDIYRSDLEGSGPGNIADALRINFR